MTAYDKLMDHARETRALEQVAGRLGWDQETMMPRGAADQRAEESAAMEAVLHGRRTDPQVGDWLEAATATDDVAAAQLRLIRRTYDRATKVSADLATEIARVTSRSHSQWAAARADVDWPAFVPVLEEVLRLKREEAAALADDGDLYDALLDDFEPGATGAGLASMFGALRPRLVALRERILDRPAPEPLRGRFDEAAQLRLTHKVAETFGYDFHHGRIDLAVHPFSSGSGHDVRITTRTNPKDPFGSLYATIHEVGHGAYELGIDDAYLLTPLGHGVSMGVHESQSRIYENQIGRSRAFCGWLYAQMRETFGEMNLHDADAFYRAVNRVESGFIRTEADEVHYNLHILLRFDLERQLMAGDLAVADLEDAWDARFEADFGRKVEKASDGVLQDVHWAVGLFGYFPTYTLGNVYAGCLMKALRDAIPDLDAALAEGDTSPATDWLRDNLQQHGGLREPSETIAKACGFEPSEGPLLDYIEAKFGALYGL